MPCSRNSIAAGRDDESCEEIYAASVDMVLQR